MPTGGGKSITFQVPAMALEGVCIVITPLVALMKDQVHHLRKIGIVADAIHAGVQQQDIIRILENCILGRTKLLYVSPERLGSQLFQTKLRHMRVSFITVDEAHCISQWGYDFRPAYLEISVIRTIHPDVPVLALTATATPLVVEDICRKLAKKDAPDKNGQPTAGKGTKEGLSTVGKGTPDDEERLNGFRVFRMSFERKNLAYIVKNTPDKYNALIQLLQESGGSSIVYVRSRRHAREIAEHLTDAGLSATFYHAGLEQDVKDQRQHAWQGDQVRTMVATNAFGMGIDKPDVRIVIHYDCPDSPEAYFQEAGRAGRDGLPARAVLLYNGNDRAKLSKRINDTFPPKDYIRQVYEHLAYYYQIAVGDGYGVVHEFKIEEFCMRFHHFPIQVHSALQILQRAGYIEYTDEQDNQARVRFLIERDDLYRLQNVSPDEDRVIVSLLRNYGGLFADYGYIDEQLVAKQAGLREDQTHEILKNLSQRHLISFIPRRQVPFVRYMQRRDDAEHILLSRDIYEDRLAQYKQRIEAMLKYIETDDRCRSRLLLEYFGEATSHDCGQCDVCQAEDGTPNTDACRNASKIICDLLADGKRHHITELLQLKLPTDVMDLTLSDLVDDETVIQQDGFLTLQTLTS